MSNVDKTRPMTRHQYLFRFVRSGAWVREDIEFRERLGDRMRKHTMLELESEDNGLVRTRAIIYCSGMVCGEYGGRLLETRKQLTEGK